MDLQINETIDIKSNEYGFNPGWVQIYDNGKLIIDTSNISMFRKNITLLYGKEFIAQKLVGKVPINTNYGDLTGYSISAFGIGNGGEVTSPSGINTIIAPSLYDTGLYSPIPINTSCLEVNNVNYIGKPIESSSYTVSPRLGKIEFLTNSEYNSIHGNEINDFQTTLKLTLEIEPNEPFGIQNTQTIDINEACLYITNGNNVLPFAHVTFESRKVEKDGRFTIIWFLII